MANIPSVALQLGSRDKVFEGQVLDFLWEFKAKKLRRVATDLGMPAPSDRVAKQFGYQVVARAIDSGPPPISMLDLDRRGASLKTVRATRSGVPYESTSFPAFEHTSLVRERWETATLRRQVSYLLLVLLIGREKGTPLPDCEFGDAFFWTPTDVDRERIRGDWAEYRRRIEVGRASDLPKESETQAIHVRPHSRDALDLDETPSGGGVPRKSFWLNRTFVEELISRHRS